MAQCDMCGKDAELYRAVIEGVDLNTCSNCSSHGKKIAKVKVVDKLVKKNVEGLSLGDSVERVIEDYPLKIKQARESKGFEQKELGRLLAEKESVVSRVESGSMKPSLRLARKFEKILGLSLVYEDKIKEFKGGKVLSGGMTIGDLLKK